jgi:murein peptide amidase A
MGALLASLVVAGALAMSPAIAGPGNEASGRPDPRAPGLADKLSRLERAPPRESRANGEVTIGRSAQGRPIQLSEYGLGQTRSHTILVFGCIHGTECAASSIPSFQWGCPTPARILFVPNLNPDGLAFGTLLNGRGVDLNRNFPATWRPIGQRWDLQYSGPRPFSEPESRLAARLIRAVRPEVTIWFHQEAQPMVRAWGPSVPAARRLARYSRVLGSAQYPRLPFRRLPWLAGTAPNWQNHRFDGTASFVVELPPGPLPPPAAKRLGAAVARLSWSLVRPNS